MKTISKRTIVLKALFAALLLLFGLFVVLSVYPIGTAYAAKTVYSNVLDDLEADANFDATEWQQDDEDRSLRLITVAESSANDLFLYVYQPGAVASPYYASMVRLSDCVGDDLYVRDYNLRFINQSGVFFKYKVLSYAISDDDVHVYEVVQLTRPFIRGYDTEASFDNTIGGVAFDVSKVFYLSKDGESQLIRCDDLQTIEITDKFVGFLRYSAHYYIGGNVDVNTDRHFVAFNASRPIDDLYEADVYYAEYSTYSSTWSTPREQLVGKTVTLQASNVHEVTTSISNIFHRRTFSWNEIQSIEDFKASVSPEAIISTFLFEAKEVVSLSAPMEEELDSYSWVLNFAETESRTGGSGLSYETREYYVKDVTILRLKFMYDGTVYNLGVVDNVQSGSGTPVPTESEGVSVGLTERGQQAADWFERIWGLIQDYGKLIFMIAGVCLLIAICAPIIPPVVRFVVWVVTAPFKAVSKVRQRKRQKGGAHEK